MKKMLQKIFSVKNKKNHKIVRILGIKLKFRISEKNMISSQKPVKLYDIKGQNNQIIIVENGNENIFDNIEVIDGLKIVINGSNNTIKLHKPFNLFNNVFIEISKRRREEIENNQILHKYRSKIKDIKLMDSLYPSVMNEDIDIQYIDLPF